MHQSKLGILAPCYNEGQIILSFLDELKNVLRDVKNSIQLVVIDDGSTDNTQELLEGLKWESNIKLDILLLHKNIGHQGAISQGLRYCSTLDIDNLIVMDSDGEDDPTAILTLIELTRNPIVFVARNKRRESIIFKIFYTFYKFLFLIISGKRINFGNYSMINKEVLSNLKNQRFVHYPAFLSKSNYPKNVILFDRRKRIDGASKMKFDSLLLHGFKSFIEYDENLHFIFLKILIINFMFILGGGVILHKKYILGHDVLGWTSSLIASLLIISIISLGFFVDGIMILYQFKNIQKQIDSRLSNPSYYTVINK